MIILPPDYMSVNVLWSFTMFMLHLMLHLLQLLEPKIFHVYEVIACEQRCLMDSVLKLIILDKVNIELFFVDEFKMFEILHVNAFYYM